METEKDEAPQCVSNLSDFEQIQYKIFLSINTLATSPLPHSEQIKSVFSQIQVSQCVFLWQGLLHPLSACDRRSTLRLHHTTLGISNKSSSERVRSVVKANARVV